MSKESAGHLRETEFSRKNSVSDYVRKSYLIQLCPQLPKRDECGFIIRAFI